MKTIKCLRCGCKMASLGRSKVSFEKGIWNNYACTDTKGKCISFIFLPVNHRRKFGFFEGISGLYEKKGVVYPKVTGWKKISLDSLNTGKLNRLK